MKQDIILLGAGGHCRSCIDVIEQEGRFRIAGIVDKAEEAESVEWKAERGKREEVSGEREAGRGKREEVSGKREEASGKRQAERGKGEDTSENWKKSESSVFGYPVLGTDADLPQLREQYQYALVTVGQIKTPDIRMQLFDKLLKLGFELPAIISPLAYVSKHARVAHGSIVMHHALVNAGAQIGANCIINSKALVEHDAIVGDHCHIATEAIINGGVSVGQGSFVGSNAVSRENITVGPRCVIGGGARVLTDLAAQTRHIG